MSHSRNSAAAAVLAAVSALSIATFAAQGPANPDAANAEAKRTVHYSIGFGWSANQDIAGPLAELLAGGRLTEGDELVLDHTCRIGGSFQLPDRFTISAVKGAGLAVTDPDNNRPLPDPGNGNTLRNLTMSYLDTPPLGPTGEKHGVNFA